MKWFKVNKEDFVRSINKKYGHVTDRRELKKIITLSTMQACSYKNAIKIFCYMCKYQTLNIALYVQLIIKRFFTINFFASRYSPADQYLHYTVCGTIPSGIKTIYFLARRSICIIVLTLGIGM